MVVLNVFGKIPKTCISSKLKLYIGNLPNEEFNNWEEELTQELRKAIDMHNCNVIHIDKNHLVDEIEIYKRLLSCNNPPNYPAKEDYLSEIAKNMICIFFDYEYEDMPLGDWTENCFDSRLCEDEYEEKIVNFLNFLNHNFDEESGDIPIKTPTYIYLSRNDLLDYRRLLFLGKPIDNYLDNMKKWGEYLDSFLNTQNDYYLLDYLVNAIYNDNEYNAYHFVKTFSLCETLLANSRVKKDTKFNEKLSRFIKSNSNETVFKKTVLLHQIRNKISHGDFEAYLKKTEEYAQKYMDGHYWFDYSEYSRLNWVLLHICCEIDDALRKILYLMFTEREKMNILKNE